MNVASATMTAFEQVFCLDGEMAFMQTFASTMLDVFDSVQMYAYFGCEHLHKPMRFFTRWPLGTQRMYF